MHHATPAQPSPAQRAAGLAGAALLRLLFRTLRVRVRDEGAFLTSPPPHPVIYAFWHNRILAITATFLRVYPARRSGVLVLTSASRDGMWLGQLAARLGMGSVRGSSSRRGAAAMRELLARVAAGHDIAITPDGPRGPRYQLGSGLVYLAQKAGIPILPCHAKFHGALRLKTWDRFAIPVPFSRVEVTLGTPIHVPATAGGDAFEAACRKIESALQAGAD